MKLTERTWGNIGTVIVIFVSVMVIGDLMAQTKMAYSDPTGTQTGTVLSQKDSGHGVHIFGICMSIPNCGYTTIVKLDNGSTMSYIDTCGWAPGTRMNFTYYPNMESWQQDVVLCD